MASVNTPSLKKIIIETIVHGNQVHILESEDEFVEKRGLFRFDGRENLFHRSKYNDHKVFHFRKCPYFLIYSQRTFVFFSSLTTLSGFCRQMNHFVIEVMDGV